MNILKRSVLFLLLIFLAVTARAATASFTADVTAGCAPLVVHFTNTSTGATSYFWDFGTGTTSALKDPSTSFTAPGTYTVKLTASGVTTTMTITVYPGPTISFSADDTSVCPGKMITFTSTSTGGVPGPVSCSWAFGDGGGGSGSPATHAYAASGFYNVTLIATNAMGCVSSFTKPSFVHIFSPPAISFSSATTYFCKPPGHAVFTDHTSGTPGFSYYWSFGDGSHATIANPIHDYSTTGNYDVHLTVTDGNGCIDSTTAYSYIRITNFKASFTAPAKACEGTVVPFSNTSSAHTSTKWSYGDGGTDVTDSGWHVYTPGTYSVRLIVSDGTCTDTAYRTITIMPNPVISFSISPKQACPPPVSLTLTGSVPTGSTVSWIFGDGTTGSGATVTHLYARRGIDTITMTVTDPATGCTSTATKHDTLYDIEHALIDSPYSGCKPLKVSFREIVVTHEPDTTRSFPYPYGVVSYLWDYGDGSAPVLGGSTPSHIYTDTGIFHPTVRITTGNGCVFTDTTTVLVGNPPVVDFIALNPHVCYGTDINYKITVITGPTDDFHWEFGDWDPLAQGNKWGPGLKMTYKDALPGTFIVTLTPFYHGCPGPKVNKTVIVDSPKAAYKLIIQPCVPFHGVQFKDTSMGDDTHLWVFGDGTTSTVDNPLHIYPAPNVLYTGYLATYNAKSGCRDTADFTVDFRRPAKTLSYRSHICRFTADTLTVTSSGFGSASYTWCGADSHFDYMLPLAPLPLCGVGAYTATDTFHLSGIHIVSVTTTFNDGCRVTDTFSIFVGDPKVNFTVSPATGCGPLTTVFADASVDSPGFVLSKYTWAFGDGATATITGKSTAHTFTTAGTFATKLIVTDNYGCVDSNTLSLVTVWQPEADFYTVNQFPCVGDSIQFINKSSGATSSLWFFGDGGTSSATSPWHTYTKKGNYTVKLIVTDTHGCTDTAEFISYISATQPSVSFYMIDSFVVCPPLITNFYNTSTGATFYNWDLGDGSYSSVVNPSDIYITPGLYTITLTGTDMQGCKATAIGHASIAGYAGVFSYTPLTGCAPLAVHFKALISNVPNIIWDFSDGSTSKAAFTDTADHIYTLPGSYLPKLILGDNTGCQNSTLGVDTIKVDLVTPANMNMPDPVCEKAMITYTDMSTSYFSTITSWSWSMPDGSVITTNTLSYTFDTAGTFPVTMMVTDGWGCTGSVTKDVLVHPLPKIVACPDTVMCVSDKGPLVASGGDTYSWTPATTLSCADCNPVIASPLAATTYTVTGKDKYGCINTDTVRVSLITKTVSHASGEAEVCRGVVVQLHDSGGTSYQWVPAAGLSNATDAAPYATPDATTRYTVIAYLGSCIPDTEVVWVTIHQLPTVDAGPDQKLVEGSVAQLDATGSLIEKYSWSPDPTLTCDTCLTTTATMSVTTTYIINVATDFGCKASDTVTIHIYCDQSQIFVPNTFTPNGDGQNDVFYPRGVGVKIVKSFRIYNRWGELLFERSNIHLNDASQAWDGSYLGNTAKPDVYVYVLESFCETGEPINIKGDVTVIR